MEVSVEPWSDTAAAHVFQQLDVNDHIEAELTRGHTAVGVGLFADWRAMEPYRVLSHVLSCGPSRRPFAVIGLANTGQAGVAQAAFLARDHEKHRAALIRTALMIRAGMAEFARVNGIHRIEARCWAGHPTAARFLKHLGFRFETDLPGFGADGSVTFLQFAWITPELLKGT